MLFQLPNGDWINPKQVESVRTLPGEYASHEGGRDLMARVIVHHGGYATVIECASFDEAKEMCGTVGAEINAACAT